MFNFQKKYYKKYPAGSCGNIHNFHLEEIGLIVPNSKALYLTFGVLYENDKNVYEVETDKGKFNKDILKIFGINSGEQHIFKYHAWITLDSGEIIDLAHYFTLSKKYKNNKILAPIFGKADTIFKKHQIRYIPHYISGHITNRRYGIENGIIFQFIK